jgi:hypothetical protein
MENLFLQVAFYPRPGQTECLSYDNSSTPEGEKTMRHLRLLIIAVTTFSVLALGVFALANRQAAPPAPADDDIVIKGGSLEIQCGKNHNMDCLGTNDSVGKYKHKQSGKHVTKIVVKRSDGVVVFNSDLTPVGNKPEVVITYK